MAEEKDVAELREKVARAAQLLLFRRHMQPGVKAWELKRDLGRNYLEVIKVLDVELGKLGLTVKKVEGGEEGSDSDRYFVTMRGHPAVSEARTFGWRIDDMAILSVALSYILSKQGKAPLKEVERVLEEKFPRWKAEQDIDRFIRRGYLEEDDEGVLYIGWRTRAEVDQKALLGLLLGREKVAEEKAKPEGNPEVGKNEREAEENAQ
jgi:hypothetical protein